MRLLAFIETPIFSQDAASLADSDLRALQDLLMKDPTAGAGLGSGLYKIRVSGASRGKRSGARVLYCYHEKCGRVYLMFIFWKGESENLSSAGLRALRQLADALQKEAC